jgi:DnaJ-class molecular chaperone
MAPEKKTPNREPTFFEVLSISPRTLEGQDPASQAKIARQAYRRALLKHHPDRQVQARKTDENAAGAAASSDSSSSSSSSSASASASAPNSSQHFTVDQITEAYTVLSDAKKRREYTRTLRAHTKTTVSGGGGANRNTKRRPTRSKAGAGTDTVVVLDDDMSWDGKRKLYYRACGGCGKARGFSLKEAEIEEDSEEDSELTLECVGCARSLTVLVPALDDEEQDGGQYWNGQWNSGLQTQQPQPQMQGVAPQQQQHNQKDAEPPKKSRGWGFRLGLGLSLGGGVSARAGR